MKVLSNISTLKTMAGVRKGEYRERDILRLHEMKTFAVRNIEPSIKRMIM